MATSATDQYPADSLAAAVTSGNHAGIIHDPMRTLVPNQLGPGARLVSGMVDAVDQPV